MPALGRRRFLNGKRLTAVTPNPAAASPAGALIGLTIGVAMAAGRLTSDATQESLGGTGSVVAGVVPAMNAAVIVATRCLIDIDGFSSVYENRRK